MRALFLVLTLMGCSSEEPEPPQALHEKQCVEGGRMYKLGATWACSDGCNTCKCVAEGVETTTVACDASPPFMVDTSVPPDSRPPATDTSVADTSGG